MKPEEVFMEDELLGLYTCEVTSTPDEGWFLAVDDQGDDLSFHTDDIQPEDKELFKMGAKFVFTIKRVHKHGTKRVEYINFIKET